MLISIHQSGILNSIINMTTILDIQIAKEFLNKNNISDPQISKVAGDASFRSYYRVISQNLSYILMYAPVKLENTAPFIQIDEILLNYNLRAPKIIARDTNMGLLLLEDFGDISFTKFLKENPQKEFEIYSKACDKIITIHQKSNLNNSLEIKKYNHAILINEVFLFIDWYLKLNNQTISPEQKMFFKNEFFNLFDKLNKANQVLVHRDYHADNLMIISKDNKFEDIGIIDFQDALIGSYAYDLLSLLEDARRDVDQSNQQKLFDYFIKSSNYDYHQFMIDYEVISLQRNIKILGIFARLALRDNKKQYLDYIPRVKNFVLQRIDKTSIISNYFKGFLKNYL